MKSSTLPWDADINDPNWNGNISSNGRYVARAKEDEDAAYIVHAANAYPKLVEALKDITHLIDAYPRSFNAEEVNMCIYLENAHVLLRELGEAT